MVKEIGSDFELDLNSIGNDMSTINLEEYGISGTDTAFVSSGRSAQNLVLDEIENRNTTFKKMALIPPFTCKTVIEPFVTRNYKIITYSIDCELEVNAIQFKKEVEDSCAQVVLIHQYFGFNTCASLTNVIKELQKSNIIFIEDRTQCLYSEFPVLPANYIVGSFRKWHGLPDGGYAVCSTGEFSKKPLKHNEELENLKLIACRLKYNYLNYNLGEKKVFLDLYAKSENMIGDNKELYAISPMSIKIQNSINLSVLCKKRRDNYSYLFNRIKTLSSYQAVMGALSNSVVPLYFPIYISNRNDLQIFMRDACIFAPIIWKKSNIPLSICEQAQFIYENIICIPIDQRYDIEDMERIYLVLKEYNDKKINTKKEPEISINKKFSKERIDKIK